MVASPRWTLILAVAAASVLTGVPALSAQSARTAQTAQTAQEEATLIRTGEFAFDADRLGIEPAEVTFSRDIAPILQRSCQNCHNDQGVAPMPLLTYEQVQPWAQMIKFRTGLRDQAGAMPPWYVEKDIGIQHYKQDPSLSDRELALIAAWADNGAPEGDPADLPPAREFGDGNEWRIQPDLVVTSEEIFMEGGAPDWWGEIPSIPIPLEEDRYVKAVEIREINDVPRTGTGRETVGGRFIVHHMIWRTQVPDEERGEATGWPVHEVGRNPDFFDQDAARLLKAGSHAMTESVHLHSNGRDTRARLEIGFELHPPGYEPRYERARVALANGSDIDVRANQAGQELHAYHALTEHTKFISFEPHLHAPGERMCLEAIWGFKAETLACVGYDHNWVRTYSFADGYQPLLPKGTIVHIIGYMNNSETNRNVTDPRNWQGSGNRSMANMFIDLGIQVALTDEQFVEEVERRVERFQLTKSDYFIGCPVCLAIVETPGARPLGLAEGERLPGPAEPPEPGRALEP